MEDADGVSGPLTPIGPADTVRFVTNDFMYTGGDGYTVFASGTNVAQPGDDLLQVAIDYITAELAGRPGGRGADRRAVTGRRLRMDEESRPARAGSRPED